MPEQPYASNDVTKPFLTLPNALVQKKAGYTYGLIVREPRLLHHRAGAWRG